MQPHLKLTALRLVGISLLGAFCAQANQFNIGDTLTVGESSINPNLVVDVTIASPSLTYSGGVYAGINQLLINGSQIVNGFCIDPFDYSSGSSLPYKVVDLANAPKNDALTGNTAMGSVAAQTIKFLWGAHYSSSMSAADAATLQLAIWDVVAGNIPGGVGGKYFSTTSSLNSTAEAWISTVDASGYNGPSADLVGLTGTGQDYVVQNVPEAGFTMVLLGLGMVGLVAVRKTFSLSLS